MKKLGIALYPDKTTLEEDQRYLEIAAKLGYTRLFMSLLQLYADPDKGLERIKATLKIANELGFEAIVDVSSHIFKKFNIDYRDLSFFKKLGVAGLRLDMGYTGKEEAIMTHNKENLKIEINMSNYNHYLEQILDYEPNTDNLVASHNFFPQAYTGLDTDYFLKCSKKFKENNIRSAAFVTAQTAKIGPWPLQEGLCTIEEHRDLPIETQVKHYRMMNSVEDLLIGNAYASEEELAKCATAFFETEVKVKVVLDNASELEQELITEMDHTYRGDYSSYMIRSSWPRFTYKDQAIPAKKEQKEIQVGDLLILNDTYGQYKGELQIALKARKADSRINIVGHVAAEELVLLPYLKPFQNFKLVEK